MKKMRIGAWILLVMAVVFCLTACGNKNAGNGSTSSSEYGTTAPSTSGAYESTTGGVGETGGTSGNGSTQMNGTSGTGAAGSTIDSTENTNGSTIMEESSGGIIRDMLDDAETMLDNTGNAIKHE